LEETAVHHGGALEEIAALAAQRVGTGLLDDDEGAGSGVAVFGRHGASDHLNFLNADRDGIEGRAAVHAGGQDPIFKLGGLIALAAIDVPIAQSAGPRRIAGLDLGSVIQNALFPMLVVGKFVKIGTVHHLAGGRSLRLQQGEGAGNLDGFVNRADLELHIHVQILANAESKTVAALFLESSGGDRHFIRPVDQGRHTEQTVAVGDAGNGHVRLRLGHRDLRVWYDRSTRIRNSAGNDASVVLRQHGRREQDSERYEPYSMPSWTTTHLFSFWPTDLGKEHPVDYYQFRNLKQSLSGGYGGFLGRSLPPATVSER
jgi:hypothetical protein